LNAALNLAFYGFSGAGVKNTQPNHLQEACNSYQSRILPRADEMKALGRSAHDSSASLVIARSLTQS
jgi:hypothetical protein